MHQQPLDALKSSMFIQLLDSLLFQAAQLHVVQKNTQFPSEFFTVVHLLNL